MPVCRDPDNDGRNVPARVARVAGQLPQLDLSKDAAPLNSGAGGCWVTAGYVRDVSTNDWKPFVDDHLALRAGFWRMVEVPMIRLPAVGECP